MIRRGKLALGAYFFVSGFVFAAWASRIPTLQTKLQLSDIQLGSLLAALPAGVMTTMPLVPWVLNRLGSRITMFTSAILYSLLLFLISQADSLWQAVVVLFLFGVSRNFYNISLNTQAVTLQKLSATSIMTRFHGVWSVSALLGAGLSFLVIQWGVPFQTHFLGIALLALVVLLAIFRYTLSPEQDKSAAKFAWPEPALLKLGMIGFASMVCEGAMSDWCGIYLKKNVHVPETLIAIGYVAYLLMMVIGRFAGDKIIGLAGDFRVLYASSLLIATGFLTCILLPSLATTIVGYLLIGLGVSCIMPLIFALSSKVSNRSTASSLAAISIISYSGFLAGPPVIGYLAGHFGLEYGFLLCFFLALLILYLATSLRTRAGKVAG